MNADVQEAGDVALPADEGSIELAVEVFRMLSDATRVRLLVALLDGELSVTGLAERVGKPGPAVSQHLAKLRLGHLVATRRHGTQIFYRVESQHVRQLVTDAVHHAEHAAGGLPRHHRLGTDASPVQQETLRGSD